MKRKKRPKIDVLDFQISAFGEEITRLNALPKKQRLSYIAQRQRDFKTPDDLVLEQGFPTEYWSSTDEIPKEIAKLPTEHQSCLSRTKYKRGRVI